MIAQVKRPDPHWGQDTGGGRHKQEASAFTETDEGKNQLVEELNKLAKDDKWLMAAIVSRLQSGKRLSPPELNYLRRHNPELYAQARRVMAERDAYEHKLRNARSKDEARRIHTTMTVMGAAGAMRSAKGGDAAGVESAGMSNAALNDEYRKYTATKQYHDLPEKYEKKKRNRFLIIGSG